VRGTGGNGLFDLRPNAFWILNDFIRPKPNDAPTFALYRRRSSRICFDLEGVMIAIDLDDKFSRYAGEISEVETNRMLPAEFCAADTARPQ